MRFAPGIIISMSVCSSLIQSSITVKSSSPVIRSLPMINLCVTKGSLLRPLELTPDALVFCRDAVISCDCISVYRRSASLFIAVDSLATRCASVCNRPTFDSNLATIVFTGSNSVNLFFISSRILPCSLKFVLIVAIIPLNKSVLSSNILLLLIKSACNIGFINSFN